MTDFSHLRVGAQPAKASSDNPETSTFKTTSGVSNVQLGGQPDVHQPYVNREPQVQVHGGVTRAVINGDDVRVTELNTSRNIANESARTGILDTAHSQSGSRQSANNVTEESLVRIGERQFRVKELLAVGVLKKMPDGSIVEATGSHAQQAQQQSPEKSHHEPREKQAHEAEPVALADAKLEQAVTSLAENTSGTEQVALLNSIVEGRGLNTVALERMASESGQSVEQVSATVQAFADGLTRQAANVVEAAGIDFETFKELAQQHDPNGLQGAMRQLAMFRSPAGFAEVAKDVLANLDKLDPDTVKAAVSDTGVTVRWLPNGRAVVRAPGKSEMLWSVAVRQGVIKVGR